MASRKIETKVSVSYQVLVQEDAGQSFGVKVSENFNNTGAARAIASTQDQDAATLIIPAAAEKTIDVSNLGVIDYMFLKADGDFTVQFGAGDIIPVGRVFLKDGALPTGVTTITIGNLDTTKLINLTYSFLGH